MELPKPAEDPRAEVLARLSFARGEGIWPNGERHLFTDAFGVALLTSLYRTSGDDHWLRVAQHLVGEVDRALLVDLEAQDYHALTMWIFALMRLGDIDARHRRSAIALAREIHGQAKSAVDPFYGHVIYRLLDEESLREEIGELEEIVADTYESLVVRQDLALGSMLWLTHFFPNEPWARLQESRSLEMLDRLWVDPPGYFCRLPGYEAIKYAFTNYVIAIGLRAVNERPERRWLLHEFFRYYRSGDAYDRDPITHVLYCCALFPGELLVPSRR